MTKLADSFDRFYYERRREGSHDEKGAGEQI